MPKSRGVQVGYFLVQLLEYPHWVSLLQGNRYQSNPIFEETGWPLIPPIALHEVLPHFKSNI